MRVALQVLTTPLRGLAARVRGTSRLLQASGLLVLLTTVWFSVNVFTPVGPPALLWLPSPVGAALVTAVFLRTSRADWLAASTRRFWRLLCLNGVLTGVAGLAQLFAAVSHPEAAAAQTGAVALAADGAAVLVVIFALYRLPLKTQTPGAVLRVGLDAGTVMLATAVFIWHFQRPALISLDGVGPLVGSLMLSVLGVAAVLAVAKVVLASYESIDKVALRLLGFALLIGSVGPLTQTLLTAWPNLAAAQLLIPTVFFIGACAGERQRTVRPGPRRGVAEPRRRPFSLLPYIAVAAVDGLLVVVTWSTEGSDESEIVIAAVLLTGLVVLRQITAFRDNGRLLAQLDHGATHDALTQLPNRVLFAERLQKALTAPGTRPVAVALIDLDDFKEVNDTLGHEIGDLLLIAVAERLSACVRVEDTVARLGGDEFVVVLDGADPTAASLATRRMMDALQQPVLAGGHELPIRASIGIADGGTGDEASVLLRQADIAMYAAKNLTGTACLHYQGDMATTVTDHAHLGGELREAISAEQLFLLYQPIVALDGGRIFGAEALVRWAHPVRGTMAPDSFIPVAERTGLIVPLGRWVLREACRQLAAWIAEHGDAAPGVLNVNISARDLREPGFAVEVAAVLDEFHIPAERLVLEVTETMALELGTSVTNLHQLRVLGVKVSLDDFGTGHSPLTLLHDCPVDELKLDRSFVQVENGGRPTIAAAVIHLAQALGLHAVAEGVETAEQAELLLSLGYVAAQGYYFARPMLPEKFDEVLRDDRAPAAVSEPVVWRLSA